LWLRLVAYPIVVLQGAYKNAYLGYTQFLHTDIKVGTKDLPGANKLEYY